MPLATPTRSGPTTETPPRRELRGVVERITLTELVIGRRILAAEDPATAYTLELPGFVEVLLADGFRPEPGGAWYYDQFASWMRFPLNR